MTAPATAGDWIRAAARRLHAADRPLAEARALLAHALELAPERLFAYPETPLPPDRAAIAAAWLDRRAGGEPLSRILGRREFWSLTFEIGPDVLDPRADTETLVQCGLAALAETPAPRILDLGTGSGCILLALLFERPDAWGLGVERAVGACRVASRNARRHGLDDRAALLVGDWTDALGAGRFDLIVSNPPYVATETGPKPDAATARFDPAAALYAGPDGLDAYRRLLPDLPRLLAPGGQIALEIGAGQEADVRRIGEAAGLLFQGAESDLAGHIRAMRFVNRKAGPVGK